ncbi:unnamed protein product [Caenorhabditis bovis]|uniref:Serpentine receptor class gamma n=1 Tax=Caenorhabditis bovis TaxID=2654633 RepID=A0A8S1EE92_9PELO|nr:unnamed protein product [Caenorhabditis bovis]
MFTIKFAVTFSYGSISLLLETLIVYMMFRYWKEYSNSFFKLYIASYFFNLITFLNTLITLIYWDKSFAFIMVIITIFPFTQTYEVFLNRAYYTYTAVLDCYAVKTEANSAQIYNSVFAFLIVCTAITAIINVLSVCRLGLMSANIATAERNLLFVSFASFVIELFAASNTGFNKLSTGNQDAPLYKIAQTLLPFTSDALTFNSPWVLLFSSKVRDSMMKLFFPKRYSHVSATQTPVFVSTGRHSLHMY